MSIDISIVVPLYNKAPEIARCLQSVLAQTVTNFELIVIDDGSTDNGYEVVASFSDKRIAFVRQQNSGVSATRNRGTAMASARLVAYLDADDEWLPDHLESILTLAREYPNAGLIATGYWISRGGGWNRRVRVQRRFFRRGTSLLADYYATPEGKILPSATAVDKYCLVDAGGYRDTFGEDTDLYLRIAAIAPIACTRRATAIWHLDAQNRRCLENSQSRDLYRVVSPNGTLKLLDEMHAPRAAVEKVYDYLLRRERWAIVNILLDNDRSHARYLYSSWKDTYGTDSLTVRTLLILPDLLIGLLGRGYRRCIKVRSALAYGRDLWRSRHTFAPKQ